MSPAKRPRKQDESSADSPALTRSDIWYSDGSIVLQAESTLFRVHRTILAAHSTIFNDMLTIGNGDGSALVEGCPLVELSDAARDVAYLLRAVYSPSFFEVHNVLPFAAACAIGRLGRKYNMPYYYGKVLSYFRQDYPMELDQFCNKLLAHRPQSQTSNTHFHVLIAAHAAGIQCVLPQLYYMCYKHYGIEGLFRVDDHGSFSMSPDDQRVCLTGWERLCAASSQLVRELPKIVNSTNCTRGSVFGCRASTEIYRNVLQMEDQAQGRLELVGTEWKAEWSKNMCTMCVLACRTAYNTGRQDIWRRLPSFYGMPSWDELQAQSVL